MTRITIPYAIADFIDLRKRGFYYVDKTNYITELENYNALYEEVTTNDSFLHTFFKVIKKGNFRIIRSEPIIYICGNKGYKCREV